MVNNVVITSIDHNIKVPSGIVAQVKVEGERIRWGFSSEEKAAQAAERFMNAGFSYVYRPIIEPSKNNPVLVMNGRPIGTLSRQGI